MDAFGDVQSVALVGGTSEIGLAVVVALAEAGRLGRVVLAGRDTEGLAAAEQLVRVATGVTSVRTETFEATRTSTHEDMVRSLFQDGDVDVVVLAVGALGDTDPQLDDPDAAVRLAEVNYVAGLSVGLRAARRLRSQGHGAMVVLSSVAGLRGRASNFVYGSSKAGLDTFAQGLGDRLRADGVRVVVVRPGFVRSRMTAGRPSAPLACDPEDVGRAVVDALRRGRETVWVPRAMQAAMLVLTVLPRPLFRRLRL
jgi:decaprenylphospho-beta-D-erythro-pentofuranosid-2-ulose 2-reductase